METEVALPNIVHPTTFKIGGYLLRVATYFAVTDRQAALIAMHAYRRKKWLKKDQAPKVHTILWSGDQELLAMLG